jgi:hypothetical protein
LKKVIHNKTVIVIMVIVISVLMLTSMVKFNTPNFVFSGIGLIRVVFTEAGVVKIQSSPQVYLAKSDDAQQALIDFMAQRGYQYYEKERIASTLVFGNEVSKQYVDISINRYFSKWVFNE